MLTPTTTLLGIPQACPSLRIARFRTAIDDAIAQVIDGRAYILGPFVERFEASIAAYLGVKHAVGVGNGTDAIKLALQALGVGPGDEVIAPALTAVATAQAILATGAKIRFADVDAATRCLDPDAVEAAVTPQTAAIVAVHLFGQPCDVAALGRIADRHGLALIEDAAQAHGATVLSRRVGTFGKAAAFSFYPTKPLGAIGDGGAVVTDDLSLAVRLRMLRTYGWSGPERISGVLAGNSRLDALQAAILSALLPSLDTTNRERVAIAAAYRTGLEGLDIQLPYEDCGSVYHQFAVRVKQRDRLRRWLVECAGVQTAVHYWPALHHHPAFAAYKNDELPVTDALAAGLVSLPIEPEVAGPQLARLVDAVSRGIRECQAL